MNVLIVNCAAANPQRFSARRVDNSALEADWEKQVGDILDQAGLKVPDEKWQVKGGREGYHSESLGHLLNEMQSVHRAYPGCDW